MCDYSELEMANAFEETLINNNIPRLTKFDLIFREAVCQQGIADFIGLNVNKPFSSFSFNSISSMESCVQVLSLLKIGSGRTFRFLQSKTGISSGSLSRILKEMLSNGYIKEEKSLYYRCIPDISKNINVWAFELKLNDWKRALFQSLQYKAVSNYSAVVFPFNKHRVLINNLHFFKELNIGVLLFDMKTKESKWLNYPKKEHPISKWNAFLILGKLICDSNDENYIDL